MPRSAYALFDSTRGIHACSSARVRWPEMQDRSCSWELGPPGCPPGVASPSRAEARVTSTVVSRLRLRWPYRAPLPADHDSAFLSAFGLLVTSGVWRPFSRGSGHLSRPAAVADCQARPVGRVPRPCRPTNRRSLPSNDEARSAPESPCSGPSQERAGKSFKIKRDSAVSDQQPQSTGRRTIGHRESI